ncbi:unnamed protein product [Phytomonas sp. Hart1]|nr:unnamed protein product [Phytomonas sp. Hart1]|eukprot:CCW71796.1 unnamed protein product [Phytomonas sp. isolate Hart1]
MSAGPPSPPEHQYVHGTIVHTFECRITPCKTACHLRCAILNSPCRRPQHTLPCINPESAPHLLSEGRPSVTRRAAQSALAHSVKLQ